MVELAVLFPRLPTERTQLLDNLGRIRREVGPITPELSDALADHMNIRRGEVHEVVSFYSFLQVPHDARPRLHRADLRLLRGARAAREHARSDRGRMPRPLRSRARHDARRRDRPRGHARDERRPGARARAARRDARRLRGARRPRAPPQPALARAHRRGAQGLGAHRLRRRRLPDRDQVGGRRPRARPASCRRQRGRGRARDDQGSLRDGAPAASLPRGRVDRDALRRGDRGPRSTSARSTRPLVTDCCRRSTSFARRGSWKAARSGS